MIQLLESPHDWLRTFEGAGLDAFLLYYPCGDAPEDLLTDWQDGLRTSLVGYRNLSKVIEARAASLRTQDFADVPSAALEETILFCNRFGKIVRKRLVEYECLEVDVRTTKLRWSGAVYLRIAEILGDILHCLTSIRSLAMDAKARNLVDGFLGMSTTSSDHLCRQGGRAA